MASEKQRNQNLTMRVILLAALFVIVIGATYPIREAAIQDEKNNNYETKTNLALSQAKIDLDNVTARTHTIDDLMAARDRMVAALYAKNDLAPAIQIYTQQMGETWGQAPNQYNARWVETCRKLADIHRDALQLEAALVCYQSVLDHDQKYLPRTSPLLVRDTNNMGMIHYLIGTGFQEKEKRLAEFGKAKTYLDQAEAMIKEQKLEGTPREAATLWNLYLVERDSGNPEAESIRQKAASIDKAMNRVCREP